MKKILHTFALLFITLLLLSCSSSFYGIDNGTDSGTGNGLGNETSPSVVDNTKACNKGAVRLSADFSTGRMDKCQLVTENEYLITLIPESTPINSSPWYAFKVEADQPTKIKITMKVQGDKHRYPPKIKRASKSWQLQKHQINNGRLTMTLIATPKASFIAAQEIIDNNYYIDWANKLLSDGIITHELLGESTQGRPIYKLESKAKTNEWLVILGRMHPPEVTGALALFPFVENLFSTSNLAIDFRNKYNILIIPNINPDGVAVGNWRYNANGLDLNRDWIDFSQVETQQINKYLQALVSKGDKIKFAVDFHSTQEDVFYSMPVDYGVEQPYFVKHWLATLDKIMPNFTVVTKPGNTPNNGVSKQYFSDNFNIHAITYEVGDNTDRRKIVDIAINASNTLMTTLLLNEDHNQE